MKSILIILTIGMMRSPRNGVNLESFPPKLFTIIWLLMPLVYITNISGNPSFLTKLKSFAG